MEPRSVLDDPAFQSAFIAVAHLVGAPQAPLPGAPSTHTVELAAALESPDRAVRASALARELQQLARRLQDRRVA